MNTVNKIPLMPFPIKLTEEAAKMASNEMKNKEDSYLRIAVYGGGCTGIQYALTIVSEKSEIDFLDNQYNINIVIDPYSAVYLIDAQLIYIIDIYNGPSFKFENTKGINNCDCNGYYR